MPISKTKFRSKFEKETASSMTKKGLIYAYEPLRISYKHPETNHYYTPDFILDNGIIIETKGRLTLSDRVKHILLKHQYPALDIRFVFMNSKQKINKNSKTTYGEWCQSKGFTYVDKHIPTSWFKENPNIENTKKLLELGYKRFIDRGYS